MDKQKQIEELAKDLYGEIDYDVNYYSGDNYSEVNFNYIETAKNIVEKGWVKIPENAVVLMGTETEQRFEDLMVAFDEMGFMPNTTHPFPEEYVETWKQRLIFVFGQLRKETAEKFAEKVKMAFYYHFDELIPSIMAKDIDEICKEITEGK